MFNVNASSFSFNPTAMSPVKEISNSEKYIIRKEVKARKRQHEAAETKYKTELCKSWCENGHCRYGDNCKFAHGLAEINVDDSVTKKQKNCKVFFATGYCNYGVRCQFLHEHRHINQIKRYANTVRLITYESLFTNSKDQTEFIHSYDSGVKKLSIFE